MPVHVALGSPFAAGPGIEPVIAAGCRRSGNNHPHLVAARLGYDLVDVTSGGATVDDVVSRPQVLMAGGTAPPQLDAVVPDADLVTVTVGGNESTTCSPCRAAPTGSTQEAPPPRPERSSGRRSTPAPSTPRSPRCRRGWPGRETPCAGAHRGPGSCWSTT